MKENLEPCRHCGGKATINESCEGIDDLCEIWIISCDDCPAEMRGARVEIPLKPTVVKGDTCIDWSTGIKLFNISLAFIYQLWYRHANEILF